MQEVGHIYSSSVMPGCELNQEIFVSSVVMQVFIWYTWLCTCRSHKLEVFLMEVHNQFFAWS